jgi:hypothetical protein
LPSSVTAGRGQVVALPSGSGAMTRGSTVWPAGPSIKTRTGVQQPTFIRPAKPTEASVIRTWASSARRPAANQKLEATTASKHHLRRAAAQP